MSNAQRPLYLICNDDGVHASGLRALAAAVRELGEVVVVAPHVERSATSHAITIGQPLRVENLGDGVYAVEGTPADCVMLALRKILHRRPVWVLSGINRGANLGIDTLYSGTVHAAMEGSLHRVRGMAISALGRTSLRYDTAAKVVQTLLREQSWAEQLPEDATININVPCLGYEELKGIRVAGLGRRIYDDEMVEGIDPRGRPYYWIGAGGEMFEDILESDCLLSDEGYVTASVLRPALLDEAANHRLKAMLPTNLLGAK